MSRFAKLADMARPKERVEPVAITSSGTPPSRIGRKAISGYFSPEMSLAVHMCARRNGISLQALMAEAFDDVLQKYGESPVGE